MTGCVRDLKRVTEDLEDFIGELENDIEKLETALASATEERDSYQDDFLEEHNKTIKLENEIESLKGGK